MAHRAWLTRIQRAEPSQMAIPAAACSKAARKSASPSAPALRTGGTPRVGVGIGGLMARAPAASLPPGLDAHKPLPVSVPLRHAPEHETAPRVRYSLPLPRRPAAGREGPHGTHGHGTGAADTTRSAPRRGTQAHRRKARLPPRVPAPPR